MTDAPDHFPLAAEFPPATYEQWRKLVEGVLKGARFEERLQSRSADDLTIEPLYRRARRAASLAARAPGTRWDVMQRVDHPDPAAANAHALQDLGNGATGLTLVCAGSINANGYGIDGSAETLARVLDGVQLDAGITIDFNVSPETRGIVRHFAALVKRRNIAPAAVELRASINPIGGMAAAGGSPQSWNELAPGFASLVGELAGHGFRGPFAVADGRIVHNAGGSEAQELAFAIASAVAYLRAIEAGGTPLDAARSMIYFRLAADADQFLTIAKFRALRRLWARIEKACGLEPEPAYVSAETAWRMMTQRAPWVNLLRTTVAIFSAAIGGANAIGALPHTAALGLPNGFARRIARNAQLVLLDESNLAKVSDPIAGSGAGEVLTEQLCGAAWTLFQEFERAGGIGPSLEQGLVQSKIAAVRAARQAAVARGTDALIGISDYPDLAEMPVTVLDAKPTAPAPILPAAIAFPALPRIRLAEPYEKLRDDSDRMLARTSVRPKVFLANLGTAAEFNARATFAKNFFAAGGIEAVTNDGFKDGDAMLVAFQSSGAALACLCGSDDVYAAQGANAARALKAAGAKSVYLAGRPKEHDAFKAAGVETFIFAGCDTLTILQGAHDRMGDRN